jgi:hypothetical protein
MNAMIEYQCLQILTMIENNNEIIVGQGEQMTEIDVFQLWPMRETCCILVDRYIFQANTTTHIQMLKIRQTNGNRIETCPCHIRACMKNKFS